MSRILGSIVLLLLVATSCKTIPPSGFVEVPSRSGRDFEAVSPDGEVFATSTHANPETGDLDFWTEAIQRELGEQRGYALRGSVLNLSSKGGLEGREMLFDAPPTAGPYVYLVTIFVGSSLFEGPQIHVIEACLEAEGADQRLDAIRKAAAARF